MLLQADPGSVHIREPARLASDMTEIKSLDSSTHFIPWSEEEHTHKTSGPKLTEASQSFLWLQRNEN